MHGILAGVAAVGIAIVSRTMRPGETQFFLSFAKRAAMLAPFRRSGCSSKCCRCPSLPIRSGPARKPPSDIRSAGAISIDIGASVMALGFYLTIVAVAFWSAAVAVDRQRAEWILFSLMTATALIGLTVAATNLFGLPYFDSKTSAFERTQAIDCVAMGVLIAAAAGIRTLERYETRRASPGRSVSALLRTFAACGVALAICIAVLIMSAPVGTLVATGFGAVALTSVVLIRRLGLGSWGIAAIALPAIAIAGFLAASEPRLRTRRASRLPSRRKPRRL